MTMTMMKMSIITSITTMTMMKMSITTTTITAITIITDWRMQNRARP